MWERSPERVAGSRPLVLVAHDAVNRLLLADLAPHLGRADHLRQRTACWNLLYLVDGQWQVACVDETSS